jgi:SulP family sulfate permease
MPADFFSQIGVLAQHLHTFNPLPSRWRSAWPAWPGRGAVAQVLPCPPGPGLCAAHGARRACAGHHRGAGGGHAGGDLLKLPVETIGTRFGGIPQALPALPCPSSAGQCVKLLVIPR